MSRISHFFGSVMVRLVVIFGALAAMTVAAITIGWLVFQSISGGMASFTDTDLPALKASADVAAVTDQTRNALSEILIAHDQEALSAVEAQTAEVLGLLQKRITTLPRAETEFLQPLVKEVSTSLETLAQARRAAFVNTKSVRATFENAFELSTEVSGMLEEASDNAYFDLVQGGDQTIQSVGATLNALIDTDFTLYQTTLSIRSEMNLLSGAALARSQTRDSAMLSIIEDLASASAGRLEGMLAEVTALDDTAEWIVPIQSARDVMARRASPTDILAARQEVDAALSSALDDMYFDLVIHSDEAKTTNEVSIRQLLDEQVTAIRDQAVLSIAARSFFGAAMQVALAQDRIELQTRADAMEQSRQHLVDTLEGQSAEVMEKLEKLLVLADPTDGIAATREHAFDVQETAMLAARSAADSVRKIADEVGGFVLATTAKINGTANAIKTEVLDAQGKIQHVGLLSLFIVGLSPILIWLMISRPLGLITNTTERLAGGDLSEVQGLEGRKGEIGRLAAALEVFRNSALERIQLEEQERARQAKDREDERQAMRDKEAAAQRARDEEAERQKQEQARIAQDEAKDAALRAAAEAERKARSDEQELVVSELAQSLNRLSTGDLSQTIETKFPGAYEGLRQDYNAAVSNLSELIQKISGSSNIIDASTSEVSSASQDLAKRTEAAAATLAETAGALDTLTSSVALTATGASEATTTVAVVKSDAEISQGVMQKAVTAMDAIEKSSSEISNIVAVIDEIAFQTNLLALNAGVEAARAGESGQGFAVVASEVRSLALRCSEAALQINKIVSASMEEVEAGVSLIDQSNNALNKIMDGISDITSHVSHIASSATQQSSGISEINASLTDLDRSTQQNAAMFEETTAASQSLTAEASKLTDVVSGFRVFGQGGLEVLQEHEEPNAA